MPRPAPRSTGAQSRCSTESAFQNTPALFLRLDGWFAPRRPWALAAEVALVDERQGPSAALPHNRCYSTGVVASQFLLPEEWCSRPLGECAQTTSRSARDSLRLCSPPSKGAAPQAPQPVPAVVGDPVALPRLARGADRQGGVHGPALPQARRGDPGGPPLVDRCRLADGAGVQAREALPQAARRGCQRSLTGIRIRTRPDPPARIAQAAINRRTATSCRRGVVVIEDLLDFERPVDPCKPPRVGA